MKIKEPTILLWTDLHLSLNFAVRSEGLKLFYGSRAEDGINVLRQVVQIQNEYNVTPIFLGDVCEKKDKHPSELLNPFIDEVEGFNIEKYVLEAYFLMGNHDYDVKSSPFFRLLELHDSCHFVSEKEYHDVGGESFCFIPHGEEITKEDANVKGSYVCLHDEIKGVVYDNNYKPGKVVIKPSVFKGSKMVFSGHIHKPQEMDVNGVRIIYVGSVYETDFGESHIGRVLLLNARTGKMAPVKLDSPRFFTISKKGGIHKSKSRLLKGNYIRLKWELTRDEFKALDLDQLEEKLKKFGVKGYKPSFIVDNFDFDEKIFVDEEIEENDTEYFLEKIAEESDLDKDALMKFGKKLIKEE